MTNPDEPVCEDCGTTEDLTFEPCPFAEDVHGDDTKVWLCEQCSNDRAWEI